MDTSISKLLELAQGIADHIGPLPALALAVGLGLGCGGLTDEQLEKRRSESMSKAAHADTLRRLETERKATEAYAKAKKASDRAVLDSIPTCAHDGMVCETDGWSQRTKPSSDADLSTYCFFSVANAKVRYYSPSRKGFDRCVTERKRLGGTTCMDTLGAQCGTIEDRH